MLLLLEKCGASVEDVDGSQCDPEVDCSDADKQNVRRHTDPESRCASQSEKINRRTL